MPSNYDVFIPARNAARTIELTLRSLQVQAHPPRKVVVLDDGSTDSTAAVADRCGAAVLPVAGGRGLAAAQNAALAHIESGLIAFVDADDAWTRHAGETLVSVLDGDADLAAAAGRAAVFGEDELARSVLERCASSAAWTGRADPVHAADLWLRNQATKSATMFRTATLLEVGGYRELPSAEDYDLLLRFYAAGHRIAVVQDVVCWRMVAASSMTANSERMLAGEVSALEHFHATSARRALLPRASLGRRRVLAWRRALVRDVQYHASTRHAPDPPLAAPWGTVLGGLVRAFPGPVLQMGLRASELLRTRRRRASSGGSG